jgi:pimeloyl-ACP methyl ester carboxylesterase
MSSVTSPFKSAEGERDYMAAYETTMRLWPVSYNSMDLGSRFGSTHVVVCGPADGPPLVILHCFFTSLTTWVNNIADFSRSFRVYAPDMMGQPGKSIPDQPIRTRVEMAEWLTSVLEGCGISQTDLVGYSYGGFAALNYVIETGPTRIKKLVLLSPAGGLVPLRRQFYLRGTFNTIAGAISPALARYTMRSFFRWMFYKRNLRREDLRPIVDCTFNQMYLGSVHFRSEYASPQNFVYPNIIYTDQELKRVSQPTLLLIGQQEALYNPLAAAKRARQLIPTIQAEIVPNAGHDMPVSRAEIVDEKVLAFLKSPNNETSF